MAFLNKENMFLKRNERELMKRELVSTMKMVEINRRMIQLERDIESICRLNHDAYDLVLLHKSLEEFLETICEFYKQGVFFLDDDGFLDYDMDKEGEVGALFNPDVAYWSEG